MNRPDDQDESVLGIPTQSQFCNSWSNLSSKGLLLTAVVWRGAGDLRSRVWRDRKNGPNSGVSFSLALEVHLSNRFTNPWQGQIEKDHVQYEGRQW